MRTTTILFSVTTTTIALLACGGGDTPPATAPTSSASSAKSGECFASFTKKRPDGWVDAGQLVIKTKDEMPVSYEVQDMAGKKVDSGEVDPKGARQAADQMAQKACKVGGLLVVYQEKAKDDGTMNATIVKPAKEDEAGDVAMLCKQPDGLPDGLDDAQKRRVAVEAYEGRLTSAKWRGWLFDMSSKVRKSDDAGRPAIMNAKADELDGIAKTKDCWFSSTLKKK